MIISCQPIERALQSYTVPPSPIILTSPLVLLIGAGASEPLDKPLMAYFIKKISGEIIEEKPAELLRYLTAFCGEDLEAIMGELDTLIGLKYATSVDGSRQIKTADGPYTDHYSLRRSDAKRLQWLVKHAVIREYRNINPDKTVELYGPLFDLLFSKLPAGKRCLVIFTTNYDPAIEIFCQEQFKEYNLCDGFEYDLADRHNYWDRLTFDKFRLDERKRNIVLFKIHGSVDWIYVKATDKIRRGQAMYDAVDADAYANVLIYPATRKIATSEPYYSGYEYYQRCCEAARACLAIGYSFRDYDALTRLRGASSINDKLELVLVSPDAEAVLKTVPIPERQKLAIPSAFGHAGLSDVEAFLRKLPYFS